MESCLLVRKSENTYPISAGNEITKSYFYLLGGLSNPNTMKRSYYGIDRYYLISVR